MFETEPVLSELYLEKSHYFTVQCGLNWLELLVVLLLVCYPGRVGCCMAIWFR